MSESTPQTELASGTRLRCPRCRAEAIVTGAGPAELRCCDGPLETVSVGGKA
jgi:hypothetical protein